MSEVDRLASFLMSSTLRAARGLDLLRRLQDEQHVLSDQDAFDSHVHSREAEKENHKDPHTRSKWLVCNVLAQEEEAVRGKVEDDPQQQDAL